MPDLDSARPVTPLPQVSVGTVHWIPLTPGGYSSRSRLIVREETSLMAYSPLGFLRFWFEAKEERKTDKAKWKLDFVSARPVTPLRQVSVGTGHWIPLTPGGY